MLPCSISAVSCYSAWPSPWAVPPWACSGPPHPTCMGTHRKQLFLRPSKTEWLKKEPSKTLGLKSPTWNLTSQPKAPFWVSTRASRPKKTCSTMQITYSSFCFIEQEIRNIYANIIVQIETFAFWKDHLGLQKGSLSLKIFFKILKLRSYIFFRLPSKTKDVSSDHFSMKSCKLLVKLPICMCWKLTLTHFSRKGIF